MHDTTSRLSDLASAHPAAAGVFQRHRLDFCCGGQRTLAEACGDAGIDAESVLAEIVAAPRAHRGPDLRSLGVDELVGHILERYHEPLRTELPRLLAMARRVERVHADKAGCPVGLAAHLDDWTTSVLEHLDKEEKVLFPAIASPDPAVITALTREHVDHGGALVRTRRLTGDLVPPAAACTTWRALYLGLMELERELMEHVRIENNFLFPRAMAR